MRTSSLGSLAACALPVVLWLPACTGGSDTPASPAGTAPVDTADTAAGAMDCPPPPTPDLSGCTVHLRDDADPKRDEPDHSWWWLDETGRQIGSVAEDGDEPEEKTLSCAQTWGEGEQLLAEQCWGMATYTYTWSWEDGLATGKVYDKGSDGEADRTWAYSYDSDGHLREEAWDTDLDGVHDNGGVRYTWEGGLLLEEHWDYQGDGSDDLVVVRAYDDGGFEVLVETDQDGDGALDERISLAFDAGGNPLWDKVDTGADGSTEKTTTWSYEDCINIRVDMSEAGSPDVRFLRSWEDDGFLWRESEYNDDVDGWDAQRKWDRTCPSDADPPSPP